MNISIRKFLLINLLLAITITMFLTAIGNYFLDQKDIQRHSDTLMALSTMSYQALLGSDVSKLNLAELQKRLDKVPDHISTFFKNQYSPKVTQEITEHFSFQLWTLDGKLLLRSSKAPKISLSTGKLGFSDRNIDGIKWRVFTHKDKGANSYIVVAERYDSRLQLGRQIAQDDFYIMLCTFALSGLLIWIIIGRGLGSLSKVAKEVGNRAPNYLEPVNQEGVPKEIRPVIDELNKLFLRLQQAFDREQRFAADAAHELRTPLAALKTQAQVALRSDDEKETKKALKNVIAGVDRSSHIVQQLLTMSRIVPEAAPEPETTNVNLPRLAAEVTAQLAPSALEKNIDIELNTDKETTVVNGNTTALSILIRNLVDNAIRYTPEGGIVRVDILESADVVTVRVSDNGPGIPAELRARVFERFFRVLGNKSPGSGLGLAIVQQIAKLHHATVNLSEPETGSGLQVEVIFPA